MSDFHEIHLLLVLWLVKKRLLCVFASREHAFQEFVGTARGQSLFGSNHDVGYKVFFFFKQCTILTTQRKVDFGLRLRMNSLMRFPVVLMPLT
jgi:hypothetical protein